MSVWIILLSVVVGGLLSLLPLLLLQILHERKRLVFSAHRSLSNGQPRELKLPKSDLIDKSARVRQLRGKYAHLGISSEEFAAQKQEEIRLEDRK